MKMPKYYKVVKVDHTDNGFIYHFKVRWWGYPIVLFNIIMNKLKGKQI